MGWDIQSGICKKRFLKLVKSVLERSSGNGRLGRREALAVCIGLVFKKYLLLFQGLYLSLSQHLFNAPTEACMLAATSTSSFENTCFFKVLLALNLSVENASRT